MVKLYKKKEELYVKSIKEFFISSVKHLQKAKLKKMLDRTKLDHIHWLHTTPQGRQELKRSREVCDRRQHKIYLDNVARRINAHANFQREQKGLPVRRFQSDI